MSPDEAIAALDNALAENGEQFVLRRLVGTGASELNVDVTCVAWITALSVEQIDAGLPETELNVIFSPTQINDGQWPGGTVPKLPPFDIDQRLPRANVDKAIVQKKLRVVTFVNAISLGGVLVRINMRVAG